MSLRLRTLGTVTLEQDGVQVAGRSTQRRRLGLLILLAASRDRPASRDKLVGLLWPELDTGRARAALSQALYWIRQELGPDVVLGTVDDLRIDPSVLTSDRREFDSAVGSGDLERAVALYEGPFCDGFFVTAAPELEEWLEGERRILAVAHSGALEALARRASAQGNHRIAVELWGKFFRLDPLSSPAVLGLMGSLDSAGDRAGAIREGQAHLERLNAQLGLPPDPAVSELIARLRAGRPAATKTSFNKEVISGPAAAPSLTPQEAPSPASVKPSMRLRVGWAAGVGALVLLATLAIRSLGEPNASEISVGGGRPTRLAVLPFTVHGSARIGYLRDAMADLLTASLSGLAGLRPVEAGAVRALLVRDSGAANPEPGVVIARELQADRYSTGEVVEAGDQIRIHAAIFDPARPRAALAEASAEGSVEELFQLVDQVTTRLVAPRGRGPEGRLTRLAATTTRSLPAFRAYLEGESELRAGQWQRAAELFKEATVADSGFALAHYRLGSSLLHTPVDFETKNQSGDRAVRFGAGLPRSEQLLFEGFRAMLRGDAERAERTLRDLLFEFPDHVEGWFTLGWNYYLYNYLHGRSTHEAGEAFERALAIDPENAATLDGMARLAWIRRDYQRAISLEDQQSVLARRHAGDSAGLGLGDHALRTIVLGDRAARAALDRELEGATVEVLADINSRLMEYSDNRDDADGFARRVAGSTEPLARSWALRALADNAVASGRIRAGLALSDSVSAGSRPAAMARAYFELLPFLPPDQARLTAARAGLLALPPPSATINSTGDTTAIIFALDSSRMISRVYLAGILSARLGDAAAVDRSVHTLEGVRGPPVVATLASELALGIRAEAARVQGRPAEALALLERTRRHFPQDVLPYSPYYAQDYSRYLRAELLLALGRDREALAWFAAHSETSERGRLYEAHAHLRQGQILERLGDRRAVLHYQKFVEMWRECDAELRPLVTEAERALVRLNGKVK